METLCDVTLDGHFVAAGTLFRGTMRRFLGFVALGIFSQVVFRAHCASVSTDRPKQRRSPAGEAPADTPRGADARVAPHVPGCSLTVHPTSAYLFGCNSSRPKGGCFRLQRRFARAAPRQCESGVPGGVADGRRRQDRGPRVFQQRGVQSLEQNLQRER